MVMQAEELLLLKLIQFSRHFWVSTPAATMSTEDAKSIDFLQQAVLEAEGGYSRWVYKNNPKVFEKMPLLICFWNLITDKFHLQAFCPTTSFISIVCESSFHRSV